MVASDSLGTSKNNLPRRFTSGQQGSFRKWSLSASKGEVRAHQGTTALGFPTVHRLHAKANVKWLVVAGKNHAPALRRWPHDKIRGQGIQHNASSWKQSQNVSWQCAGATKKSKFPHIPNGKRDKFDKNRTHTNGECWWQWRSRLSDDSCRTGKYWKPWWYRVRMSYWSSFFYCVKKSCIQWRNSKTDHQDVLLSKTHTFPRATGMAGCIKFNGTESRQRLLWILQERTLGATADWEALESDKAYSRLR